MPTYLNTPHVARMLGVNIQTVRAYIRSGELSAARSAAAARLGPPGGAKGDGFAQPVTSVRKAPPRAQRARRLLARGIVTSGTSTSAGRG